mgnify:CR=1 FL=1
MTAPYYTLLTNIGAAKLANATATDTPLSITQMGVGDANGTLPTPDPGQTSLIHECRRADLNTLKTDPNNPNQIIAEQVLPDNVGGWYIRELGLYDAEGDLIAVGNCPPSYKPLIEEGASREQVIRMILIVTSDSAVTLKIDPAVVLATREYVDDAIEAHAKSRNHPDATTSEKGFVQLSSATDSDDETKAATLKAVKAVKEIADAAVKTVNTHEPDIHGNVKLGSAADADITTTTSDPTPGRVTRVGDGGLLGAALSVTNDNLVDKDGLASLFFRQGGGASSDHFGAFGNGLHLMYGDSAEGKQTLSANLFVDYSGNLTVEWLAINKADGTVAVRHLQKLFGTLNPPTAAQSGAMPYFGTALNVDLNTLGPYAAAGVHYQPSNAGATTANHYPVAEAGALLVLPSAYGCQQEYTTFGTRRKFIRGLTSTFSVNGPWSEWVELYSSQYPGEIYGTSANNFRIAYGGYGAFWRQDGGHLYLMLTNKNDPLGNYNALRPFYVDMATGYPTMSRLSLSDYTNFDARYNAKYPAQFRVGARVTYNGSDFGSHVPQGAVNINNYTNNDDRINGVVYAYLQYSLNGNWVNFA